MSNIGIYRYPNGISLNGCEWVLTEKDDLMLFDSSEEAVTWLNNEANESDGPMSEEEWERAGIYVGEYLDWLSEEENTNA
tara:strand:- start:49 stop:288 length:240 start_codon:yes stop_codon:yes gene_type:complete